MNVFLRRVLPFLNLCPLLYEQICLMGFDNNSIIISFHYSLNVLQPHISSLKQAVDVLHKNTENSEDIVIIVSSCKQSQEKF